MTPQERDIIGGIFDRLRTAEGQPRDPQAEAFIAERIRSQPYAPYIMAQTIYMQEQALANLQGQIEELERRPAPQQGGFLSSLFGGGGQRQAPPPPAYQQQPMGGPPMGQPGGPWQGQPGMAQQPQQRGGMGFLGTAAAAAVGVAGGMMAANALQNAFSHGAAGPQAAADFGGGAQPQNASWSDNSGSDWGGGGSQGASSDWGGGGGDWGGGGGDDV